MVKLAPNLVVKSIDTDTLCLIQSKGDFDYREFVNLKNSGKLSFCVNTDQFLNVVDEGLTNITQEPTSVKIETGTGEYTLPIFRERGVFVTEPEVSMPDEDPIESWEYDFSNKTVNSKSLGPTARPNSMLVMIGPDCLLRSINNILEKYGDVSTAKVAILPPQYILLSRMGKVTISIYQTGELKAVCGQAEIHIKKTAKFPDLVKLENSIFSGNSLVEFDISELKLKTFNKFVLEKVQMEINPNTGLTFITESARKTMEIPNLVLSDPIKATLWANDLKYLAGKIGVYPSAINPNFYTLVSKDKEKTVYILVPKA